MLSSASEKGTIGTVLFVPTDLSTAPAASVEMTFGDVL